MRIWTSEHTFNHPWETVAQAAWRKYPNPMNPAVIGTDVVERNVVNGVLHTHRLVSSKWYFPRWAQAIIGTAKICYASERSIVDPNGKIMTLKTINLTFGRHISVDEMLYYTPHPTEPSKTLLKQEATVSVHGVPLSHYMEDLLTNRISSNAGNGRLGLEWVISKINTECHHEILNDSLSTKTTTATTTTTTTTNQLPSLEQNQSFSSCQSENNLTSITLTTVPPSSNRLLVGTTTAVNVNTTTTAQSSNQNKNSKETLTTIKTTTSDTEPHFIISIRNL